MKHVIHQNMKTIFQLLILLAMSLDLYAQETCTEKLYRASILYDKGQIKEAINIALDALGNHVEHNAIREYLNSTEKDYRD